MKFCKDCQYYNQSSYEGASANDCLHPKNTMHIEPNMITGDTTTFQMNAPQWMRTQSWLDSVLFGNCGKPGRWFKKAPTIINLDEVFIPLKLVD
jgi:hypothetical protein